MVVPLQIEIENTSKKAAKLKGSSLFNTNLLKAMKVTPMQGEYESLSEIKIHDYEVALVRVQSSVNFRKYRGYIGTIGNESLIKDLVLDSDLQSTLVDVPLNEKMISDFIASIPPKTKYTITFFPKQNINFKLN